MASPFRKTAGGLAAVVLALGAVTAAAQTRPPVPDTAPPPTAEPRPVQPVPGSGSSTAEQSGSLSDQLSRSGGVIQPPAAVDPGMRQTPPNPGPNSMPVVPPVGTPENNPQIKPK